MMPLVSPAQIPKELEADYRRVREGSLETCRREGLSQAQLDCILEIKNGEDLLRLLECPPIAQHQPSWLVLTPPELVDQLKAIDDEVPPPRLEGHDP